MDAADNMLVTRDFSSLYYEIPFRVIALHTRKYAVQSRIVNDNYAANLRVFYSKQLNLQAAIIGDPEALEARKKLKNAAFLVGAAHYCLPLRV